MPTVRIINNAKKYAGKYVATASFNDKKVIASGKDASKVRKQAIDKGYKSPVMLFIPRKNTIHIY
jgi:hypothetical protein